MSVYVNNLELDGLIAALSNEYRIFAPVSKNSRGRFSDTDLIVYDEVVSGDSIVFDKKSYRSAKEIVLPITQTLFRYEEDTLHEISEKKPERILLFCRSCDVHALGRLDNIFIKNGPEPDPYYCSIRDRIDIALIECEQPFDSCFCVTMKANITDDFLFSIRPENGGFVLTENQGAVLGDKLKGAGTKINSVTKFPLVDGAPVSLPEISTMPESLFTHEMWNEYSLRCIACGRCNTSCPTCSCFSVYDVKLDKEKNSVGERKRVWDGCHLDGFTTMAGGGAFRKEYGPRMRYKTFHKIYDYKNRYGVNMCVGCGRCDDVCPEYISFSNCINKVSAAISNTREDLQ